MKKEHIFVLVLVLLIAGITTLAVISNKKNAPTANPVLTTALQTTAQCLADTGVKFYGASWCSHCANQKALFMKSVKTLPYIECAPTAEEARKVAKEVLPQYNAGTYTGIYKESLDQAKAAGKISVWVPSQTEVCINAKIQTYPTWEFADSTRQVGEISPLDLAVKSSCVLDDAQKSELEIQNAEFVKSKQAQQP